MPKVVDSVSKHLAPFLFHGVRLDIYNIHDSGNAKPQVIGDCPFCGKERKFHVGVSDGCWDCKRCALAGNIPLFLQKLWEESRDATPEEAYVQLSEERGLLSPDTVREWGGVQSLIHGDWMIPGHNIKGEVRQLYTYAYSTAAGKAVLTPTKGVEQHIHGVHLYDPNKPFVYICEGCWDAMCLYEMLKRVRQRNDGAYTLTSDEERSLLAGCNILATPSCNVFHDSWLPLLEDKRVVILYDNDHPRVNPSTGKEVEPASYLGMRRAIKIMTSGSVCPKEIDYLRWGGAGEIYNGDLPAGYDLRDALSISEDGNRAGSPQERLPLLSDLLNAVYPIPKEWAEQDLSRPKEERLRIQPLPCDRWNVLVEEWKRAMEWTPGLEKALAFMMSVVASTPVVGDQLWGRVISPASAGKTTLAEAMAINRKYIHMESTITGMHSGYKSDKDGTEDHSLIAKIKDKTLIVKDANTLIGSPNLPRILAECRDLYDRNTRSYYRHGLSRVYENHPTTMIWLGTLSTKDIDSAELGERFLDCIIMKGIEEKQEDKIVMRVANRARSNLGFLSNCNQATSIPPEHLRAYQLTGGYVYYLRSNAEHLFKNIQFPDKHLTTCCQLAKLVSYMRSRPSRKPEETIEREMSSRLTSQLVRLAGCLAVVYNRPSVDDGVMKTTAAVAMDTADGLSMDLCRHLHPVGDGGLNVRTLRIWLNEPDDKILTLLRHLKKMEAVYTQKRKGDGVMWIMTKRLRRLWDSLSDFIGS